ncbi:response regulator [Puia sp. P3]|uniref:response regulator n=1 Tax=Puia sp. P3 TaxID=3423952 RepID=UPI003D679EEF
MEPGSLFTLSDVPEEIPDDRNYLQPDDKVLLIVEDDTLFAQSLLDFTRKKGYKGIVAVSGDAGIQMARRYRPMGILLDIQLPVKNGWEVMDELKRNPQTRGIPVHIMSSYEVRNESLMKGAVDFMSKQALFGNMEEAFGKIDYWLNRNARKVLIVEDNIRHAQALAWFLSSHHLNMEIAATIQESIGMLGKESVHGVILSRALGKEELDGLEVIRKDQSLENVPIIVFTGMNISKGEEARLRKFADSIVVKTAHSYQRVLDEVSLFLHVVSENRGERGGQRLWQARRAGRGAEGQDRAGGRRRRKEYLFADKGAGAAQDEGVIRDGREGGAGHGGEGAAGYRPDGHDDAGDGWVRGDQQDAEESEAEAPSHYCGYGQGDDGGPGKVHTGWGFGLYFEAGGHRSAAIFVTDMALREVNLRNGVQPHTI